MLILPAIDLRGGKAVRLAQGDFARETVYGDDPAEVAKGFRDAGAEWVHVVDLDGARTGAPAHWNQIEEIATTGLNVEVGGGVRSLEAARRFLNQGAARVVVGTRLVSNPDLAANFFEELGGRVVAGIDARDGMVHISGWEAGSNITAVDLAIRVAGQGAKRIILTDIARDGMQTGPNLELLREVTRATKLPIIQSGGIGSLAHIRELLALGEGMPEGVIVGRAIYEGSVDLAEALRIGHK